jgi:hypothetical protein
MMWKSTKAKSWTTTRIETWATPGVPDVDICDERGLFHKVELKVADGNKVDLRPHQVAYLTRHQHASVWILVKKVLTLKDDYELFLYHGRQAVDVRMDGLKTRPVLHLPSCDDWTPIFETIAPTEQTE